MCGILGYTHVNRRLPRGVVDAALQSLTHRGPDHQGCFQSELISLGATRLRILDLESGDQPLISPDGDVIVVFNGEIFNHHELRPSHRFYSFDPEEGEAVVYKLPDLAGEEKPCTC